MARVEWIKLDVDIFSNPKLKRIRREEFGNEKLLIWVMLLTVAGQSNEGGLLRMGDGIPYSIDDFVDEFRFPEEVVKGAIESFTKYGLIKDVGGCMGLPGWEEHQNVEGLDKIREQTRQRVAKHRSKQCNATSNATVTLCNATDIDRDIDKELDKDKEYISSISYPIMTASRHYQALNTSRTIKLTGVTSEALNEADTDLQEGQG